MAALALAACASAGATPADDAAGPPSGPLPADLAPWIAFHAGFEGRLGATRAAGASEPVRVQGEPGFEDGRIGRAVRLGVGARLEYAAAGNLDLGRPGGLSFWVSPYGWEAAGSGGARYVPFVVVGGRGRSSFVVQRDRRQGDAERLLAGFFDLPGGEEYFLALDLESLWRPRSWHLVAVTWDRAGFAVSVDGGPFVRRGVPEGRIERSFVPPKAEGGLLVGPRDAEAVLIDDLAVYTRPLRDEDVARLWRAGLQGAQGS